LLSRHATWTPAFHGASALRERLQLLHDLRPVGAQTAKDATLKAAADDRLRADQLDVARLAELEQRVIDRVERDVEAPGQVGGAGVMLDERKQDGQPDGVLDRSQQPNQV
jgi:hypothetical protein